LQALIPEEQTLEDEEEQREALIRTLVKAARDRSRG
jgi:hypothetical protein